MNKQYMTPAFGLFQELGHIALLMFSDVVDLRRREQLGPNCPYIFSKKDEEVICDKNSHPCVKKIASSPRFPWEIQNLRIALRRGELWLHTDQASRRSSMVTDHNSGTRALVQQTLLLARKMALSSPRYAKLAFDLTDADIDDLIDATDIAMIEAATHVRLAFRSNSYRAVFRAYLATKGAAVKDSQGMTGHITRMTGVGLPRTK